MEPDIYPHERRVLKELTARGFRAAVVYDIGASTGIWSENIARVLPNAEYHLFEPLANRAELYQETLRERLWRLPNLKVHPVALGDANGPAEMCVFRDFFSSSLHDPGDNPDVTDKIVVTKHRLDDYVSENGLPAPNIIKIDSQGAEDAILQGAKEALKSAQVLFLETWLVRGYGPKTPLLGEIIDLLRPHSFSLVDFGERFYDRKHRLYAIDAFFVADSLVEGEWLVARPDDAKELAAKLQALTSNRRFAMYDFHERDDSRRPVLKDADVIITHIEVNNQHGVGSLVGKLFHEERNIVSLRSADRYDGRQEFGDLALRVSHASPSRDAVFAGVLHAFGESTAKRILCAPYFPDDVRTAVAVKELFGVPMCTYMMDDRNICAAGIPDDLMKELLEKSSLRLAISPEIRIVYEQKYGYRMWYMPPVVPGRLIPSRLSVPHTLPDHRHGVIIGNIWGRRWVELLRQTVRNSGVTLAWYSNGQFRDLPCDRESLIADSIFPHDPPQDDDLVKTLRETWFAVLPTGTLEESDDHGFIAQLSLPSRLPYLMATSHIPVLVLGSRETGAARFVEQFGIGLVADYGKRSFLEAVNRITQRDANLAMRRNALAVAGRFTDAGAAEWIWQSLARGEPIDRRYEDLMPQTQPDLSGLPAARRGT